jgi:phosphatidylserine decarboxylase precursor
VRWFVRKYGVDMSEAAIAGDRRLRELQRLLHPALSKARGRSADADLVCPVDGTISQYGTIEHDQILQAKGHRLLDDGAGRRRSRLAAQFHDGSFATLYLSRRTTTGSTCRATARLSRMIHVPGALFSVNPTTARGVPGLFARNERVVCVFESATVGRFVLAGRRHHRRQHGHGLARHVNAAARTCPRVVLPDGAGRAEARRGDGPLHARSTVVLLFTKTRARLQSRLGARARIRSAKRWRASAQQMKRA